MASIVSLVRVYLTATHYFATEDGIVSGGIPYDGKLAQHPRISRSLSGPYWGVQQADDVQMELTNLDESLSSAFRAEEVRGKRVEIDRLDVDTGSATSRFVGEVTQITFTGSGTIELRAASQSFTFLDDTYPRVLVDNTVFSTATSKELDLGQTVPVCFGASREHVPARYVKDDQANNVYLYAAMHMPDVVNARILTVYRDGRVVPDGEWELDTTTFPGYLCIKFTRRQTISGTLQKITFDYDLTELKNDSNTVGLWYFQDNELNEGLEDATSNYNRLITNQYQSFWKFDEVLAGDNVTDELGNNTLTNNDSISFVTGRQGRKAAHIIGSGSQYFSITDAAQTGLDPGTGDFRLELLFKRANDGTYDTAFLHGLMEKSLTLSDGYLLGILNKRLYGRVGDGSSYVEVYGSTTIDAEVWTHVAMEVDRTNNTLKLFLNGAEDGSVSTSSLTGSVGNSDVFAIGGFRSSTALGDYDSAGILTNNSPLNSFHYFPGKTLSVGAVSLTNTSPFPYITDAAQTGLDFTDGQDFSVEVWAKPLVGSPSNQVMVSKLASGAGYRLFLGASGELTGQITDGTNTVTVADGNTTDLRDGKWHHLAMTVSDAGNLTLYVDGISVGSASATSVGSLANNTEFIIGAADTAHSFPVVATMDEVRVSNVARSASEIRAAYYLGLQSPVRQVRYLLESTAYGASQTVDSTTWDSAEATVLGVQSRKIKTALALVEPRTLGQYLNELLRVRGMRLGYNSSGQVTITVDTQRSVTATVGYKDGYWDNITNRPSYEKANVKDAIKTIRYLYRRGRAGDGSVKAFVLKTSARNVLTVGQENAEVELLALRDRPAADLVAYYDARRLALADEKISFSSGADLLSVSLGDLLTFYDPTVYGTGSTTLEIQRLTEQGDRFSVTATPWNSDIYSYTAGTLPSEPSNEATPDYSATPPDAATSLSATGGSGKIDLSWTNPASNFAYVVVDYKLTSASAWSFATQTSAASFTINDLSAGTYDVRLTSWNNFSLSGGVATQSSITVT